MLNFKLNKNTDFADLNSFQRVMVDIQKSMEQDDLSRPSPEEAILLISLYETAKLACAFMPFAPFLAIRNRLEPIHQELESIANGTATEEDWEELVWQNTFATKPEGLTKIHAQALQDVEAGLVEEGGWDAV